MESPCIRGPRSCYRAIVRSCEVMRTRVKMVVSCWDCTKIANYFRGKKALWRDSRCT